MSNIRTPADILADRLERMACPHVHEPPCPWDKCVAPFLAQAATMLREAYHPRTLVVQMLGGEAFHLRSFTQTWHLEDVVAVTDQPLNWQIRVRRKDAKHTQTISFKNLLDQLSNRAIAVDKQQHVS